MTHPKDGNPPPEDEYPIDEASRKAKLHKETFSTPGIGARILKRRLVPQPGNDKGDGATPPQGDKGR